MEEHRSTREGTHTEHNVPRLAPSRVRRVSWGAIFAGICVTIVLQIMLTLLGAAIGASTINPMREQNPTQGLALGSGIWLLVTGLISVWVGSCVAGRLSGGPRRADGMLHGIVTWSAATLAMLFFLATAAGTLLGGASALLGGAAASLGNSQNSQQASASTEEAVKGMFPQVGALLPPTGRTEGQSGPGNLTAMAQQDPELAGALARMESHGGANRSPQDRDQALNLLTTKHNLNQQDAANLVNQWDQQYQQAHAQASQQARQAGQTAAHGVAQGALWGFIALFLGLACAAWGGWVGTASLPRPTEAAAVAA